jgi:hypothetical protein
MVCILFSRVFVAASDQDNNQHIADGPTLEVIAEEVNVIIWGQEPDVILAKIKLKSTSG